MRKTFAIAVVGIALATGMYGSALAAPAPTTGPAFRQQVTPDAGFTTESDQGGLSNDADSGGDDSGANE